MNSLAQTDVRAPLRVLRVEDEDIVSMLTEDMLCELGYELATSVADLEDGLLVAAGGSFDVAVLDINLRCLTSYPIADILLKRGIPFIFASGYTSHGVPSRYSEPSCGLGRFCHALAKGRFALNGDQPD